MCVLACASAPTPSTKPVTPPEDASAYYPLAPGWKWAYDVDKGEERILATYAVLERLADTVIVRSGDQRLAYALVADGIARHEGLALGDFVLKSPIREGAGWPIAGGHAQVVAVGRSVTVPAGRFDNCAIIEEIRDNPARVTRTTYAAGIGPVAIEVQVREAATGRFEVAVRAALRGVTSPGADPLGAAEGTGTK